MTVVQVNELWQGRDGSEDFTGEKKYSRVFRVLTNSKFDTKVEATATGTPVIGDLFPSDHTAFCQNVSATSEIFSPTVWIVTCSFSNRQQIVSNPTDDPAQIVWGTEQYQRAAVRDRNGEGILNSAGFAFDPPKMVDDSRVVVNVKKNVANVPAWILDTRDALNSIAFDVDGFNVTPRNAKIKSVGVSEQKRRNNTNFRTITIIINLNKDGWQLDILDEGVVFINPGDPNERHSVSLDDGTRPTQTVPFDGNGGVLSNPTPVRAVYLGFQVYKEFDFNNLPLS